MDPADFFARASTARLAAGSGIERNVITRSAASMSFGPSNSAASSETPRNNARLTDCKPSKKYGILVSSATARRNSRPAGIRFVPFSYFWNCCELTPSRSASHSWVTPSSFLRSLSRLLTCWSIFVGSLLSKGRPHPRGCDDTPRSCASNTLSVAAGLTTLG